MDVIEKRFIGAFLFHDKWQSGKYHNASWLVMSFKAAYIDVIDTSHICDE
jgi:hypothetical protein